MKLGTKDTIPILVVW